MHFFRAPSMKRIVVTLTDTDARLVKQYATFWDMTQSEFLAEATRSHIHGSALRCVFSRDLLANEKVPVDKRADRPCFGYACRCCAHTAKCRAGLYDGSWEPDVRYKHLLIPNGPDHPRQECDH